MSLKTEAIKRFLTAARSLANQGMSKEAIMNFAKNEFGEITELFQRQIDNIFRRPASGIEKIKIKDPDFDNTVVKMQFDEEGIPFNPKDPLKDYSKKPRDEKYTGGMVDVEPNLSDIGHGSDALMARTRLISPGAQGTTSTGLNYLLAEDNDNIRVPFENGKNFEMYLKEREQIERQNRLEQLLREYEEDMLRKKVMEQKQMAAEGGRIGFSKGKLADKARRKFMKAAGAGAAGIAALKTGLINLAEQAGPKVEMVKETITGAPDYFFDLVSKIKMFGKKSKFGPQERMDEYSYTGKNGDQYTLTEDIVTGDAQITKDKIGIGSYGDETFDTINDRTVMEYKAPKQDVDVEAGKGTRENAEYEEYRVEFDQDGTQAGADAIDESIQKEIIEEASEKITKKADGGRIGYSKGKAVMGFLEIIKDPKKIREAIDNIFKTGDYKIDAEMAAESLVELNPQAFGNKLYDDLDDKTRMQVYSAVIDDVMGDVGKKIKEKKTDTYRFLKKVFGDSLDDMPDRDPELYQGLKEVVPIFRQKDKAKKKQELIMYMQKYLPHMSDSEIEEFIVGSRSDIEGLSGQLLRLGSGRDYKGKLDMMREASQKRKLADLEVTEEMIRKPNASGGIAKLLGE